MSMVNKYSSLILQVASLNWWLYGVMGKLLVWELTDVDSGFRYIMN